MICNQNSHKVGGETEPRFGKAVMPHLKFSGSSESASVGLAEVATTSQTSLGERVTWPLEAIAHLLLGAFLPAPSSKSGVCFSPPPFLPTCFLSPLSLFCLHTLASLWILQFSTIGIRHFCPQLILSLRCGQGNNFYSWNGAYKQINHIIFSKILSIFCNYFHLVLVTWNNRWNPRLSKLKLSAVESWSCTQAALQPARLARESQLCCRAACPVPQGPVLGSTLCLVAYPAWNSWYFKQESCSFILCCVLKYVAGAGWEVRWLGTRQELL